MSASSFEEAREQACAAVGYMRSKTITTTSLNGTTVWEVPNPSLLDPEQQKRYNALRLFIQESDELDRFNGTTDKEGNVRKGAPKDPWRNPSGELIEEDYDVRLAQVIFGERYDEFILAGGRPSDVGLFWTEMNQHVLDRAKKDSKSDGSAEPVATVAQAN